MQVGNKAVEITFIFGKPDEAAERMDLTSATAPAFLSAVAQLVFLQGDSTSVLLQCREVDIQWLIAIKRLKCGQAAASAGEQNFEKRLFGHGAAVF
ncbi:MAG TPA: hypothetical protein VLJ11_13315 [Bryobacteraceae bacterium]|nr:hypothetical protein [Bryobacteraceae bacterium]